jgi:hypothetical protein
MKQGKYTEEQIVRILKEADSVVKVTVSTIGSLDSAA